jgi:hypothetical protein
MKNLLPLLLLLLLLSVSSCKKEETLAPANNTSEKKKLLTDKPWKLTSVIDDKGNDTFKDYPNCIKDDLYIYLIDGTYKVDENIEKCNSNSPQIRVNTKWEFNDSETKIKFPDGAIIEIVSLALTNLVIKTPSNQIISYTNQ